MKKDCLSTALSNRYTPISKTVACATKYFFNNGKITIISYINRKEIIIASPI